MAACVGAACGSGVGRVGAGWAIYQDRSWYVDADTPDRIFASTPFQSCYLGRSAVS